MKKRVFLSASANKLLDERRRKLKAAIIARVVEAGYEPQEFFESGDPESIAWNFENVDRVMRRCAGAVILGFPRWAVLDGGAELSLVGEYNHYEGAVAITHGLPVLTLVERGVANRGVVWTGGGNAVCFVPEDADESWIGDADFVKRFKSWQQQINSRRDVFLGYCSKSAGTAAQIQLRLEKLGATVLNWAMDFRMGSSILNEIEKARAACTCGIFLFSEDDPLVDSTGGAAPRDNVVFEAGYFMSSKGPERSLIIRHGDAKMPADLGGAIYVHIPKSADVATIESRLGDFLSHNL